MSDLGQLRRLDRRRHPRVSARLEVGYEDSERQVFLPIGDLSEGGVFLLAADLPPIGAVAGLLLQLPGHAALLRIRGVVARQQLDSPRGFALAFDPGTLARPARTALRSYVLDQTGF